MDEALAQRISSPISSDTPAGVSVRYEPEFEQLQEEIAKLESVTARGVNWVLVVDLGTQILSDKSKDLQVACYLCRGLYEGTGYAGFAQGLRIIKELIDNYWDTLFPQRVRGRVAALDWLVEKLEQQVKARQPKAAEREAVADCKAVMEQINEGLQEKLGEQEVAWGKLYRPVRDYADELARQEAKQQASAPETAPAPTPVATGAPASAPARAESATSIQTPAPQAVTSDDDVSKSLRSCKDILKRVAVYKREKNLADPVAYRFLRLSTWIDAELPPAQNNMTQIPQVPAERLGFFEQQVEAGNHAQLVNEVESSFANAPFWLDAHRITAMALEALGHKDAQQAVIIELAAFLRRLPKLTDYQFLGGKPFADDLTRSWINDEVLTGAQTGVGSGLHGSSGGGGNTPWLEVSREAKQLATRGKFRDGVALFQQGRRQAQSTRDHFLWDVQQARFCHEAGYLDLAIHLLEPLAEQAERYHLDEWEPSLSLEISALLLMSYNKSEAKSELSSERAERREHLQSVVSRLDLTTALDLINMNK